jgi:hypothetical protein
MPAKISLVGRTFGRLFVISDGPRGRNSNGVSYRTSICRCDCGNTVTVRNASLRSGLTRSCGCLKDEMDAVNLCCVTHGLSRQGRVHPLFKVWNAMMGRCTVPTHQSFHYYGGRDEKDGGPVRICERLRSAESFVEEIGHHPGNKLTFDRENNSGHYTCGHCPECVRNGWPMNWRWVTQKRQMRNRRGNLILTYKGITGCLTDLCEHFGIDRCLVWQRLNTLKWSVERAFSTPKQRNQFG